MQRLIHCGKLCEDSCSLGSFISKRENEGGYDGTPHTFHLVLSSSAGTTTATANQLQRTMSEPQTRPTAAQRRTAAEAASLSELGSAGNHNEHDTSPPPSPLQPAPLVRALTSPSAGTTSTPPPSSPSSPSVLSRAEARATAVRAAEARESARNSSQHDDQQAAVPLMSSPPFVSGTNAAAAPLSAPAALASQPPPASPLQGVARRVSFSRPAHDGNDDDSSPSPGFLGSSPSPAGSGETGEEAGGCNGRKQSDDGYYAAAYAQAVGHGVGGLSGGAAAAAVSAAQRAFHNELVQQQRASQLQQQAAEWEYALTRQFVDSMIAWRCQAAAAGHFSSPGVPPSMANHHSLPATTYPQHTAAATAYHGHLRRQQQHTQGQYRQHMPPHTPQGLETAAAEYADKGYATSLEAAAAAAAFNHHHQQQPWRSLGPLTPTEGALPPSTSFVGGSFFVAPTAPQGFHSPGIPHFGEGRHHYHPTYHPLPAQQQQQQDTHPGQPPRTPQQRLEQLEQAQRGQRLAQRALQAGEVQAPPPPPPAVAGGGQRQAAAAAVILFLNGDDFKLALKLAVAVLLLGQDGSPKKLASLTCAAVVAFAWQVAAAHRQRNHALRPGLRGPNEPVAAAAAARQRGENGARGDGGVQNNDDDPTNAESSPAGGQEGEDEALPPLRVRGLAEGGIAPGGGFGMDLTYFFLSFFCSLVPAWSPRPAFDAEEVSRRRMLELRRTQVSDAFLLLLLLLGRGRKVGLLFGWLSCFSRLNLFLHTSWYRVCVNYPKLYLWYLSLSIDWRKSKTLAETVEAIVTRRKRMVMP